MKSYLLTFDGGLQTKLDEHLAPVNYAVGCKNVNLSKASLYPYYGLEQDGTVNGKYIKFFNNIVVSNEDELDIRHYVEFGNRLYWTNGSYNTFGLMRYDGTNVGIEATTPNAPDGTMTLAPTVGSKSTDGDYVYTYTYVDSDGIESAPSAYFSVTTVDQDVSIVIGSETNIPLDIAYRKIYRTGGNNPTFNLIAELDSAILSYTDSTRDTDVARIELSTSTGTSAPQSLDNLIENNGTFWGSVGTRIYFSAEGQPEYWGELDYLTLNDNCTGLGKFGEYVLAFTKADTYLISGYNRDTVSIRQLPYREGCVNGNTIANVGEYLLWASYNGICVFNGATIDVLTKNVLSWSNDSEIGETRFGDWGDLRFDSNVGFKIDKAIGIDGHYYAVFQDGILDIDVLNKMTASTIYYEGIKSLYYDTYNDILNIVAGDEAPYNIFQFDSDTDNYMEAIWTTPKIMTELGYGAMKHFRKVILDEKPISVTTYVGNKRFVSEGKREFYLPSGFFGNTIQFEITTNRPIRSLRFDYGGLK